MVKTGSTLTYEYSIADNQGNTRVVFTSTAPTADAPATNFQDNSSGFGNFPTGGTLNQMEVFDNDSNPATSNSTILNGGYNSQVGVTKSFKVYPGDKVKAEVYAKYRNASSDASNLSGFALMLTNAFGVNSSSTGEYLKAYNTLNDYGGAAALGTAHSSVPGAPKAFVTILLFDKNYNFLDAAWDQLDAAYEQTSVLTVKDPFDLLTKEVTVKEEGFAYVFISNESPTFVDVYFDDVKFTHTKTNVIQYNEYYPFGLQTSTSWTRDNTKDNNYLYNAANELNKTSGWYEMFYRGYDPTIGRMLQVDPYAPMYASTTTYNYALNNPVMVNDPSGGMSYADAQSAINSVSRVSNHLANIYAAWGQDWGMSPSGSQVITGAYDSPGAVAGAIAWYGFGVTSASEVMVQTFLYDVWYRNPGAKGIKIGFGKEEWLSLSELADEGLLDKYFENESKMFHYFSDEGQAIQFMVDKQGQYDKEISALMVRNSKKGNMIIVQPWENNTKYSAPSANRGIYLNDFKKMTLKGVEYEILASVHTHPLNGSYEGPSGPGNAYHGGDGDLGFYHYTNGMAMFIIGPTEVSKFNPAYPYRNTVWADTDGYHTGNRHKIGSTTGLINGDYSLFNYWRR